MFHRSWCKKGSRKWGSSNSTIYSTAFFLKATAKFRTAGTAVILSIWIWQRPGSNIKSYYLGSHNFFNYDKTQDQTAIPKELLQLQIYNRLKLRKPQITHKTKKCTKVFLSQENWHKSRSVQFSITELSLISRTKRLSGAAAWVWVLQVMSPSHWSNGNSSKNTSIKQI